MGRQQPNVTVVGKIIIHYSLDNSHGHVVANTYYLFKTFHTKKF